MQILVHAFLILLFSALTFADLHIPHFRNTPFKVRPLSGMYSLGGLQLDNQTINSPGFQIAAYGDFNNDKYSDFVSLSDDLLTLTILIYSSSTAGFWNFTSYSFTQKILGVIPADYNYDGLLDLMVMTENSDGSTMHTSVYYRSMDPPFFVPQDTYSTIPLNLDLDTQPFIFDANGDRTIDMMYVLEGTRYVLSFAEDASVQNFSKFISSDPACLDPTSALSNNFSSPHSNAFVDFNGDCAADLFITSKDEYNNLYFEIWLRTTDKSDSEFCLVDFVNMSRINLSTVSIGDMDNDGRLDLVYMDIPEDVLVPMNLHIVYNQFPTDPSVPCSLSNSAMVSPFRSDAYTSTVSINNITQVNQVTSTYIPNIRLFSPDMKNRPPKIRLGDVNIDGFLDMILVTVDGSMTNSPFGFPLMGINNGEGNGIAFDSTLASTLLPYYQVNVNSTGVEDSRTMPLSSFPTLYASFFDFDERGSLGIWMTIANQQGPTSLTGIYNFVTTPNFILKTLGLNGYVNPDTGNVLDSLGGIYPGASVECIVNDVKGNARIAKATQLGQTAYNSLDLPYAFIGLGRTNNYVQDFTMGITRNIGQSDSQQWDWTPIIPNSQLIVNPILNDDWTLDVYVSPISQTMLVVGAALVILFLLGIIILVLHLRERKQDKKDKEVFYALG